MAVNEAKAALMILRHSPGGTDHFCLSKTNNPE